MSDGRLIEGILKGGEKPRKKAITYLYSKCYPPVKKMILRHGTLQQAEDVFQEGMSVLYANLMEGKFNQQSQLSTYLIGICKNLWLTEMRRHKTMADAAMIPDLPEEPPLIVEVRALASLQNRVGEQCRQILRAYYYDNRSMEEIRQQFELSSQQVAKTKKYRCLKKLIELVEANGLTYESFLQ